VSVFTDVFGALLCLLEQFAFLIAKGLMMAVNFVIVGIADAIKLLIAALPAMPDFPQFGAGQTGWLAYFVPIGGMVELLTSAIAILVLFYAVSIALRWVKAL
jgi:hypothetical protein